MRTLRATINERECMSGDEEQGESRGITATLDKVIKAAQAVAVLAAQAYPLKCGFKILTLKAALDAPAELFERNRQARGRDLATKDANANPVEIDGRWQMDADTERLFQAEIKSLLDNQITLDCDPLFASVFPKDQRVTPGILSDLGPFFRVDV